MKNKEKYAEELLEIALSGRMVAVVNGKPCACSSAPRNCEGCLCNDRNIMICIRKKIREWAESEYEEPPVEWSKVPVDTKILVRSGNDKEWRKRHFATFEDGIVYAFSDGKTSWSSWSSEKNLTKWDQAKLAEE